MKKLAKKIMKKTPNGVFARYVIRMHMISIDILELDVHQIVENNKENNIGPMESIERRGRYPLPNYDDSYLTLLIHSDENLNFKKTN